MSDLFHEHRQKEVYDNVHE